MTFPLQQVRILDATWLLASGGGPRYLAALGADVIRFEWRSSPDHLRFLPPLAPDGGRKERDQATEPIRVEASGSMNRGGYFHDIGSGRRGISLNMHHPKGKDLFCKLLAVSDVFVEGFTATTMHRWGLPFDEMLKVNPTLVYCQQPGFGYHGKYRDYRVVGPVANAISGLNELNGLPEPYVPAGWPYSITDWTGAYNLALAILVGLHYRRRTGRGIWIDSSQVESGIAYTGSTILDYQVNGRPSTRTGNRSPVGLGAPHGAYRCRGRDRWIAITVLSEEHWRCFRDALGRPAWAFEPSFASAELRMAHEGELDEHVSAWAIGHDAYEAMQVLQNAGVPAGVCQTGEDKVDYDPQLKHLGWLVELPQTEIGTWPVRDLPIKFGRTPAHQGGLTVRGAPSYGEDNREVLSEILGLTESEIDELASEGAI